MLQYYQIIIREWSTSIPLRFLADSSISENIFYGVILCMFGVMIWNMIGDLR
jgi:hypothetical protein